MMPVAVGQQEALARRGGTTHEGRGHGSESAAPELVVCDELALLIAAARDAAWQSHCNVIGAAYHDRKDALARLRGALLGYDRARGVL